MTVQRARAAWCEVASRSGLDRVVAETVLEQRERLLPLGPYRAGELGIPGAGDDCAAGAVDERAVHAHQGIGRDPGPDVAGVRTRLVGEQRGERVRVAREDALLAGEERRALLDHPRDRPQPLDGL